MLRENEKERARKRRDRDQRVINRRQRKLIDTLDKGREIISETDPLGVDHYSYYYRDILTYEFKDLRQPHRLHKKAAFGGDRRYRCDCSWCLGDPYERANAYAEIQENIKAWDIVEPDPSWIPYDTTWEDFYVDWEEDS